MMVAWDFILHLAHYLSPIPKNAMYSLRLKDTVPISTAHL